MNKKLRNIIISFVFSALLIYVLLINISFDSLVSVLSSFSLKIIFITFFFHFLAYVFRTLVFYLFFFKKQKIGFFYLLNIHLIHNFYVHVIPASLGELSFPILLRRKIQPEKSFSILFISRILFLLLTVLLFIVAFFLNFEFFRNIEFNLLVYLYIAFTIVPIIVIFFFRKEIFKLLFRIRFLQKLKITVLNAIDNIRSDLEYLKKPKFLFIILILTCLNILALTLTYLFILKGMNIQLSIFQTLFVSSIGITFVLLPIKSIGGFGTTEGAWAIGMLLLGFSKEIAIESGFSVHLLALLNVLVMYFIGIISRAIFFGKS